MGRGKTRWKRDEYPEDWEQISKEFRESKGYTCEVCGFQQGGTLTSKAGNEYKGTVDAAHKYPNDTQNPDPELLCLCKRDHRIYDNSFQHIIDEGKHQAALHSILLQQNGWDVEWCDHPDCQGYYLKHEH